MDIEEFRNYCLSKKGATESFPFSKLPEVLVFKVMGKMFTATDIDTFDNFSVKCDPETIDELRSEFSAIEEPSYFSKKHWSRVVVDGSLSDEMLGSLIDTSYQLVVAKLSRKVKAELENNF